jgi:hypothetical protein
MSLAKRARPRHNECNNSLFILARWRDRQLEVHCLNLRKCIQNVYPVDYHQFCLRIAHHRGTRWICPIQSALRASWEDVCLEIILVIIYCPGVCNQRRHGGCNNSQLKPCCHQSLVFHNRFLVEGQTFQLCKHLWLVDQECPLVVYFVSIRFELVSKSLDRILVSALPFLESAFLSSG